MIHLLPLFSPRRHGSFTSRLYANQRDIEQKQHQKDLLCISLEITPSNLLGVIIGIVLEDHYRSIVTLQLYLRRVTTRAP